MYTKIGHFLTTIQRISVQLKKSTYIFPCIQRINVYFKVYAYSPYIGEYGSEKVCTYSPYTGELIQSFTKFSSQWGKTVYFYIIFYIGRKPQSVYRILDSISFCPFLFSYRSHSLFSRGSLGQTRLRNLFWTFNYMDE